MLWNFGGAALIIWAGKRFQLRPPGVFCLYVAIYSLGASAGSCCGSTPPTSSWASASTSGSR